MKVQIMKPLLLPLPHDHTQSLTSPSAESPTALLTLPLESVSHNRDHELACSG